MPGIQYKPYWRPPADQPSPPLDRPPPARLDLPPARLFELTGIDERLLRRLGVTRICWYTDAASDRVVVYGVVEPRGRGGLASTLRMLKAANLPFTLVERSAPPCHPVLLKRMNSVQKRYTHAPQTPCDRLEEPE